MTSQQRFFYLRDQDRKPLGAVAVVLDHGPGFTVSVAASICHPNDEFRKDKARVRALGRVQGAHDCVRAQLSEDRPLQDIVSEIMGESVLRQHPIDWSTAERLYKKQLVLMREALEGNSAQ